MRKQVVFLLLIIALAFSTACKKLEVSETDKQLFLRPEAFSSINLPYKNLERFEKFEKTKLFDGSYQLEYAFETPETELKNPLYLMQNISVEKKNSDASFSKSAEETGISVGLKLGGIEQEELKNFYSYGDSSRFYLLKKDGKPVGNYFSMRKNNKTYSIFIVGIYFDDSEDWRELIEAKLEKISDYIAN